MTTSSNNLIEQQLIRELRRAEAPYRRALAVIHASTPETGATADQIAMCLERLEPLMRQTQEIERDLAPLRQTWLALSLRPGPELQLVVNLHEQLLGNLIGRVNALEDQMQQHRRNAIPGVDTYVRHQNMQRAYQQAAR